MPKKRRSHGKDDEVASLLRALHGELKAVRVEIEAVRSQAAGSHGQLAEKLRAFVDDMVKWRESLEKQLFGTAEGQERTWVIPELRAERLEPKVRIGRSK